MNRRGFLGAMFAACAAPAIVRADSLMKVVARDTTVVAHEPRFVPVDEYAKLVPMKGEIGSWFIEPYPRNDRLDALCYQLQVWENAARDACVFGSFGPIILHADGRIERISPRDFYRVSNIETWPSQRPGRKPSKGRPIY